MIKPTQNSNKSHFKVTGRVGNYKCHRNQTNHKQHEYSEQQKAQQKT